MMPTSPHLCAPWPVVAALAMLACDPPRPAPVAVASPVEAELHGRRVVELHDGVPRPWFDAHACPVVRVERDGPWALWWAGDDGERRRLPHEADVSPGAVSLRAVAPCAVPLGAGRVELRFDTRAVAGWPAVWRPDPDGLWQIRAVRGLLQGIDGVEPHSPAWWAARTASWLVLRIPRFGYARVWLSAEEARRRAAFADPIGDVERAWLDGVALVERRGLISEVVRRRYVAAYLAVRRSAFEAAEAHLDGLDPLAVDATSRALLAHGRGILAHMLSQWGPARGHFADALDAAVRVGDHKLRRFCLESQAIIASSLGLHHQALALIEPLVDDPALHGPDRGRAALNLGIFSFQAMSRGAIARDLDRLGALYARAEALLDDRTDLMHVRISQALLALEKGDLAGARAHLARIEDRGRGTDAGAPVVLAEGAIALADGAWDVAGARFAEAERLATEWWGEHGGDYGWRADLGLARVARARGDLAAAAESVRRALARLEDVAASTDPLAGRAQFFTDRDELARLAVTVALEQGDVERAFTVADRNHGRVLRSMLWAIEVPRLGPHEVRQRDTLTKAVHAAGAEVRALRDARSKAARHRWPEIDRAIAAAEAERREAMNRTAAFLEARLPETGSSPAAVAEALSPGQVVLLVTDELDGRVGLWTDGRTYIETDLPMPALPDPPLPAEHVFVVAGGHRDVVRAAFRAAVDRPWSVSLLPVAEMLAIPPRRPTAPPVVLADPSNELPESRAEGRWVADVLPEARLHALGAATVGAMQQALETSALVHFSGHGWLDAEAPWSSHIELARGEAYDVFDMLNTRTAGGLAVLNGCETGSDALTVRDDVLGLPEALLVSGAAAVVAADEVLDDGGARDFTELFYLYGGDRRPGPALKSAMRALRDAGSENWDVWRLVGRPALAGHDESEEAP